MHPLVCSMLRSVASVGFPILQFLLAVFVEHFFISPALVKLIMRCSPAAAEFTDVLQCGMIYVHAALPETESCAGITKLLSQISLGIACPLEHNFGM